MIFSSRVDSSRSTFLLKYEKVVVDHKGLLNALGADAVKFSRQSFRNQRLGKNGKVWKKRSVPNLAGIFSDINSGKNPPSRRFDATPALIDTKQLQKSISYEIVGGNRVRIGTNRPNAAILFNGGIITQKKTNPNFNTLLERWLKKSRESMTEEHFSKIESLLYLDELSIRVSSRHFLGYSREQAWRVIHNFLQKELKARGG